MPEDAAITVVYEIGLLIVVASLGSDLFKRAKLPDLFGAILVGVFTGVPEGCSSPVLDSVSIRIGCRACSRSLCLSCVSPLPHG